MGNILQGGAMKPQPKLFRFRIAFLLSGICFITLSGTSCSLRPPKPPAEAQSTTIFVSEDGVGPLKADTESSVRHIAVLFPELQVVARDRLVRGHRVSNS